MSAALAVQKAIRARLVSNDAVTALVPPAHILDRNARPAPSPSIVIGEDQEVEGSDIGRRNVLVYSTLHVWQKESGLAGVKGIAGAIRSAMHSGRFPDASPFRFADCRVSSSRSVRDPDGEFAHGIVTIETLVHEVQS